MPITFNTNLAALGAQRNIGIASNAAQSSLSKLSSGSRVPTAKDDAAALAVGSKLKADVAGLTQASNNAAQAISLLQIADGALSTVGDMLQRMKALATQASSGQLGNSERALLNQEFTNLRTEIDRITSVTNFNGTTLLNGGDVVVDTYQGKLGSLEAAGITLSGFDTSITNDNDVFRVSYDYTANADPVADVGNLTVTNLTTGVAQTINVASLIRGKTNEALTNLTTNLSAGDTVEVNFSGLGVKLNLNSNFDVDADLNGGAAADTLTKASGTLPTGLYRAADATLLALATGTEIARSGNDFVVNSNGLTGAALADWASGTNNLFDVATGNFAIYTNNVTIDQTTFRIADFNAVAGVDIEISVNGAAYTTANTNVVTNGSTASTIRFRIVGQTNEFGTFNIAAATDTAATATQTDGVIAVNLGNLAFRADEVTTAAKSFAFKVGTGVTANDTINITVNGVTTSALGLSTSTIDTAANADTAISAINAAINTISSRRADIGASQSRLEFANASIAVSIENTTAATSALLDVDVSSEITNFTSKQVLLQAGVSLLAQANQQPALLLRLLQ